MARHRALLAAPLLVEALDLEQQGLPTRLICQKIQQTYKVPMHQATMARLLKAAKISPKSVRPIWLKTAPTVQHAEYKVWYYEGEWPKGDWKLRSQVADYLERKGLRFEDDWSNDPDWIAYLEAGTLKYQNIDARSMAADQEIDLKNDFLKNILTEDA